MSKSAIKMGLRQQKFDYGERDVWHPKVNSLNAPN